MPDPHDPDPDVVPLNSGDPLARQLIALAPAAPRLDRDAILYAAGTAARGRAVARWRAVAAAQFALLAAAGYVLLQPTPPAAESVAVVPPVPAPMAAPKPAPAPVAPSAPAPVYAGPADDAGGDAYRGLRRRADVIAAGVTALPTPVAPPPTADPAELERGLRLPPGVLAVPTPPKKDPKPDEDRP